MNITEKDELAGQTPNTPKPTQRDKVAYATALLRSAYPHGHSDFLKKVLDEIELHSDKNHDYASGGDPLGNFKRVADFLKQYPGFPYDTPYGVAIINALKQLDAIMWGLAKGIQHKVEGLHGRLQDVSIYMKLADIMLAEGTNGSVTRQDKA